MTWSLKYSFNIRNYSSVIAEIYCLSEIDNLIFWYLKKNARYFPKENIFLESKQMNNVIIFLSI